MKIKSRNKNKGGQNQLTEKIKTYYQVEIKYKKGKIYREDLVAIKKELQLNGGVLGNNCQFLFTYSTDMLQLLKVSEISMGFSIVNDPLTEFRADAGNSLQHMEVGLV